MLDDMEINFDNLLNKNRDMLNSEIEKLKQENTHHLEEIKNLKKKLFLPNQGTNPDYNSNFTQLTKDKMGETSLYESIIIHIKTLNVKYLLEIFDSYKDVSPILSFVSCVKFEL